MNRRFISNSYTQTLTVVHPAVPATPEVAAPAAPAASPVRAEPPALHAHMILDEQAIDEVGFKRYVLERGGGVHSNVVAVVAVVFVAFLIVLLALGIVRVRAGQSREGEQQQQQQQSDLEMQWDDSALNITVNPMEVIFFRTLNFK